MKVGQVIAKISENGGGEKKEKPDAKEPGKEEERPEEEKPKEAEKADETPEDEKEKSEVGEEDQQAEKIEDDETGAGKDEEEADEPEEAEARPLASSIPVFASPTVRRFAREIGIDVGNVEGTRPGGRLSIEDVKRHARETRAADGQRRAGRASKPLPDLSQWGEVESEKISKVRGVTAARMSRAWAEVPHVTLFEKADITDLAEARDRIAEELADETGGLSLTVMLIKIVALALEAHPVMRSALDTANGMIVRRHYSHIGIAVDTPNGLLVPVVREVKDKPLSELAKELERLSRRARDGKLGNQKMRGGVFTLTHLGILGTDYFTPIVNLPEGAILGVGRAAKEPLWDENAGEFVPRLMLPLSLSFDHRLIDGADGARFLHGLVEAIADPFRLALDVGASKRDSE